MNHSTTLDRIAGLAEEQWGLVTRRQLENAEIPATTLERLTAPDSLLERVAFGVYRLVGSPTPDHMGLRAAWLQLAPGVPAWERTPAEGVVSHQSAAALYGIGHLPADRHEFTLARRKQSRRRDVRLHQRHLADGEWIQLRGLPATLPARIVSDLLYDHEDPGAVAQIIVDAIRPVFDYPGAFAVSLAPHAGRFGLRRDDGLALLRWLLDLVDDEETEKWMQEARNSMHSYTDPTHAPSVSRPGLPT
jgi:predicted transcriptional regulator of viral defense system